jgi:hypothetical protein
MGASGSSTIRASDLVFSGMSAIESGGFPSAPSHVDFDGIIPVQGNAGLAIDGLLMVPPMMRTQSAKSSGRRRLLVLEKCPVAATLWRSGESNRRKSGTHS